MFVASKVGGLATAGARSGGILMSLLCVVTYNIKMIQIILFGRAKMAKAYVEPTINAKIDYLSSALF